MAFKKILLTTDLSENAAAAFPYAVELAKRSQGQIFLVHVFVETMYFYNGGMGEAPPDWSEWVADSRKREVEKLDKHAADLRESSQVPVHSVFLDGPASQSIIKFAADGHMDCIVMATHGRTGFSHLFFGSIAERIVRHAPCPVLTVRPPNPAFRKETQVGIAASHP